uniref:FAST kinase domain-containing protein 5, mitochondrial isoform X1 n=1 Tax=Vespula vulgaris TaxID=7454 RepID=UPI002128F872|nr:FAST kinase domain-containing protein 5, mitochondrial isoform X1 [Vespula vulgaris]
MNNLIKSIIKKECRNRADLVLRLSRNINYKSGVINKMVKSKEKFNYVINVRTYGNQFINERKRCNDQNLYIYDDVNSDGRITENQYARQYLQHSIHFNETIVPQRKVEVIVTDEEAEKLLNRNWSTVDTVEVVSAFRILSYNIINKSDDDVNEIRYKCILNALKENINNLTDNLLQEVLFNLLPFQKYLQDTKSFKDLIKLLDRHCEKQYKQWSINKMFLIADTFYCLDVYKNSNFIWKLLRKMNSKLNKLTPKNLVQLMFFVNINRKTPLNMYEVEVILEEHLNDLSINELGIIAMGFFKSKTKIKNPKLIKAIINRLICEINKADDITISALLKLIRYSMKYDEMINFKMLLDSIIPILSKLNLQCLMHIIHVYAKVHMYTKPLLDTVITRMYNEIKTARLKDIEKLTYALNIFSVDTTHPIYDKIIEEITSRLSNDKTEIFKYPWMYVSILRYLAIRGVFPLHLIKLAMDPSFINLRTDAYILGWEHSLLEYYLKIEKPEYTGPFLSEGILLTSTKRQWEIMQMNRKSMIDKIFTEIVYVLKEIILNDINLYTGRILPHSVKNHVVFGLDEKQNFISAESILSKIPDINIKRIDDTFPKNVKWIVLVVVHYKHTIRETNEPTGIIVAKLRQLKHIGYTPILITGNNWLKHSNIREKKDYLLHLIKNT